MTKKLFYLFIISSMLLSCSSKVEEKSVIEQPTNNDIPLDQLAKRHVEAELGIPATEKYTLKIYKAQLNDDQQEDAIIVVNRLEHAYLEAEKSGNSAKHAEIGFFGNYNILFYYDGQLKKISPAIPIMSSPLRELTVQFEHILSPAYKDIIIDYRIKDASFKDFITIKNKNPKIVFEWNEFQNLGTDSIKANYIGIVDREPGLPKDIVVYEGRLTNNQIGMKDIYNFTPIIQKGKLQRVFFYNEQMGKYATNK